MAFGLPDRILFERLADEHVRAWSELAASTAAVASLPARTLAALAGLPAPAAEPPSDQAVREERERAAHLEAQLHSAQSTIKALRQDYEALERMLERRITLALDDQKRAFYRQVEPLLTQLPVVRHSVAAGREVAAADLLALLSPLDAALASWGIVPIGEVGAELPFDPVLHQATAGAPEAGTPVRIKHVGYRLADQILRRARVTVLKVGSSPPGAE